MNRNDTQSLKEALSALADSELSENTEMTEAELIERVCDDHDAMWQCAHLTRDVLQADYTAALRPDFAARVRNQIAAEESVSLDAADYYPEGQVVSMADARQRSVGCNAKRSQHFTKRTLQAVEAGCRARSCRQSCRCDLIVLAAFTN